MREVICYRCGKKFITTNSGKMGICDKCWRKARCGNNKGYFNNGGSNTGNKTINLSGLFYKNFGLLAGEHIRIRNLKIIELDNLVDKLSKENFKLKEETTILKKGRIEL